MLLDARWDQALGIGERRDVSSQWWMGKSITCGTSWNINVL
jgi:hypothetical protein